MVKMHAGQRVRVLAHTTESTMIGRLGTVAASPICKEWSWVVMDEPLPMGLRSTFEPGSSRTMLWPNECELVSVAVKVESRMAWPWFSRFFPAA